MFQGASSINLDAKVRLSMPTRYRDVLQASAQGCLTITKHPHGCLMVFPRPEWEVFRSRIAALPMQAQWWKRIFLGNASDVELDGTSRVLVSPELASTSLSFCWVWAATLSCGTLIRMRPMKPMP